MRADVHAISTLQVVKEIRERRARLEEELSLMEEAQSELPSMLEDDPRDCIREDEYHTRHHDKHAQNHRPQHAHVVKSGVGSNLASSKQRRDGGSSHVSQAGSDAERFGGGVSIVDRSVGSRSVLGEEQSWESGRCSVFRAPGMYVRGERGCRNTGGFEAFGCAHV